MDLVKRFFEKDLKALTKLISWVENQSPQVLEIMPKIYKHIGNAKIIGITGPPGAGKSSLVDQLIFELRNQNLKVAVLAIDPSSPFSGGAVLGDRIRMQSHANDAGVFIRSVGSRGSFGGLSRTTKEIVRVFDAFGFDVILIETVGVGQTELSIMEVAHTTVVMLVPESGDTVQTLKAGLLEIADIFVVNKADRPDAQMMEQQLKEMVQLQHESRLFWAIPVLKTQAHKGIGVAELWQKIMEHEKVLNDQKGLLEKKKAQERKLEFIEILIHELKRKLLKHLPTHEIEQGTKDPYSAAQEALNNIQIK
ncbi:MAG: methylmalonyl Co-A mutase-associated GTPase MeaB [Deltaproteobacteria bacterium]|nr:methylmalonyl Co-A mutase-associated GTPase MeaB [Deltaproteobacteria bacterium]